MYDGERWVIAVAGLVACVEPPLAAPEAEALGALELALSAAPACAPPAPEDERPLVTVSLTFDDTEGGQRAAAEVLDAHGLAGTFYVNSPRLHQSSAGRGDWLSVAEARSLEARGHELGGHTLSHPRLTSLPEAEQRREIVNDRRELSRLGLAVRSLAYPYGDVEAGLDPEQGPSLPEIVAAAGYASARDTNGFSLQRCGVGPETLPPENPYRLRSARSVNNRPPASGGGAPPPPDTAETLLGWIDHAASCGGGYLPLIFHHVREDCGDGAPDYCFELGELDRLAAVLASRERCPDADAGAGCYRIDVATVSAALGDTVSPAAPEVFALRNPSLERTTASGGTECLQRLQGSQGTAQFERSTSAAHSGQASERVAIAAPFAAAAELIVSRDFGACAHFASPGERYDLALHYLAEPAAVAPTLRFVVYRLTSDYRWLAFANGGPFAAETPGAWARRAFTTPPVPEDTIALSFGLRLESVGGVAVDDFELAPGSGRQPSAAEAGARR